MPRLDMIRFIIRCNLPRPFSNHIISFSILFYVCFLSLFTHNVLSEVYDLVCIMRIASCISKQDHFDVSFSLHFHFSRNFT